VSRLRELEKALGRIEPITDMLWSQLTVGEQASYIVELENQLRAKNRLRRLDAMREQLAAGPNWGSW
jgi:uncharacterized protein YdeI (YjbR/CyaY-like superfamily)